jgi:hypothetical protein
MRLSLVMDGLSKATLEMVRLVEDPDELPCMQISRPTHEIVTTQSRPCVAGLVQSHAQCPIGTGRLRRSCSTCMGLVDARTPSS